MKNNVKIKIKSNLPLMGIGFLCILLIILFIASRVSMNTTEYTNSNGHEINSASDAAKYLSGLGREVANEPSNVRIVEIPAEFNSAYSEYNELQKTQGFDLMPYRSKTATMYTFRILNHPSSHNDVFANVLVHEGKIIAGDVVSYAIDGFLIPLIDNQ